MHLTKFQATKWKLSYLGCEAAESSQHGPASMQHLNDTVPGEGLGVS